MEMKKIADRRNMFSFFAFANLHHHTDVIDTDIFDMNIIDTDITDTDITDTDITDMDITDMDITDDINTRYQIMVKNSSIG